MKNQLIRYVSIIFDKFPVIRKLKDSLILGYYQYRYKAKASEQELPQVVKLSPDKVLETLDIYIPVVENLGSIKGGGWDNNLKHIADMDVYQAFDEHMNSGKAWGETSYYQRVVDEVLSGKIKWGCKNKTQVDARFESFDDLIHEIRTNGIVLSSERQESDPTTRLFDDIILCVNRSGQYVLHDGRHRLIIAKLLNLDVISARISIRHSEWVSFCQDVQAYAAANKKLYAPIIHPDLSFIESYHDHQRFEAMIENLPIKKGSLLDIGSHWGYFCHRYEELGFACTAIEPDEKNLYFLDRLKKAENMQFKVAKCGLFELEEPYDFNIVLALYIFHHFLKTEQSYNQLVEFLSRVNMQYMFLSTHSTLEPQMKSAYTNPGPEKFADFILESSVLTKKKCLWEASDGRKLFLLSRD